MDIKNKLTGTRGDGGGRYWGKEGEHIQRTHGQGQWRGNCLWEHRLVRVGDTNGGKWGQL